MSNTDFSQSNAENGAVLVAGGAGYIGSHAAKALRHAGFLPVVIDNLSTGHAHAVRWGPLVEADISDADAIKAACEEYSPLAAMHFAACIEVGEGEKDPELFYRNNVCATLEFLSALRASGVSKLVFSSTCATYGEPAMLPLVETEPQTPINVYGRTKLTVERMLADFGMAYGFSSASLRYFNACGASADGEIGEEHDPETHLIPNVLKAAAGLSGGLKVFGDDYGTPDGTCIRDYIHVEDLADAHVLALRRLLQTPETFALNLGTGQGTGILDVIRAAEKATGRAIPYDIHPRRAGDPPMLYAGVEKARAMLNFKPQHSSMDNIMATAWAFHKKKWNAPEA